jgi:hypothetical protein
MQMDNDKSIDVILVELSNKIEALLEKHEEMALHIKEIKEAVYHPDQGIYARLRDLENWKNAHSRILWIIGTTTLGLVTATLWNNLIG